MVIVKAKSHRNNWYLVGDVGPAEWAYAISSNGYIKDKLGLLWLEQVFEQQTAALANGAPRILITGRYGSHGTADFLTFCFTHRILLLRLPAHTSHITQPLDVGCFSSLKTTYRQEVEALCQGGANKVSKRTFIDLYDAARR